MFKKKRFEAVKEAVSKTPVLRYYSLISEVTIQCDASQYGVGAALLQNGQPVAFASRSLSEAEQRYAQIEKECLAIVFACERFHHYVYGRDKVTVHSDHQPLELIFKKPLAAAPARLQRMLLHLQYYALEVKYVKGKHMYIADTLSRAFLPNCSENSVFVNYLETVKNEATTLIGDTLMITDDRLQEIKAHSGSDSNLQAVAKMIREGWPDARNKAPECARAFYNYRDELHTEDGEVVCPRLPGSKIWIPALCMGEVAPRSYKVKVEIESIEEIDGSYWLQERDVRMTWRTEVDTDEQLDDNDLEQILQEQSLIRSCSPQQKEKE
ncbi:uncharacterized protein LOC135218028 [Macrobrachium nipponense]|uniref:uncharacterized protein LOC135218028 n=1 Tax=Macrobrachium nipponense TaxID=159736 RepID=UPI0030C8BABA